MSHPCHSMAISPGSFLIQIVIKPVKESIINKYITLIILYPSNISHLTIRLMDSYSISKFFIS